MTRQMARRGSSSESPLEKKLWHLALLALLIACLSGCSAQPTTPHILFIVVDDLGWNGPLQHYTASRD